MGKYNIWNPATARRIIHSGVEGSRPIEILPRATREGVELSDAIAEELMQRHEMDPQNELRIDFYSEEPKREAMKVHVDDSKVEVVRAKGKR